MRKLTNILLFAFVLSAAVSCKKETTTTEETITNTDTIKKTTHKIVSLNSAVTEIVAALGHESEIVGMDVTSTYPETLKNNSQRPWPRKEHICRVYHGFAAYHGACH